MASLEVLNTFDLCVTINVLKKETKDKSINGHNMHAS